MTSNLPIFDKSRKLKNTPEKLYSMRLNKTYAVTILLVLITITVALATAQSSNSICDQQVKSDCVGPGCVIGYAYQKTWTCAYYDQYHIIGHTGNVELQSGGIYSFSIIQSLHPLSVYCGVDTGGIIVFNRIDYDKVFWQAGSLASTTWTTQSGVTIYGLLC